MSSNYLCTLTNKVNELTNIIELMQLNTGLYTDPSSEQTVTGRVKALEESIISSDPEETNISRMQVDTGLDVVDGTVTTTYEPIGDCVNREVMVQSPDDSDIWEVVGNVSFTGNVAGLGTQDYNGWKATVSYIYAMKIQSEDYSFVSVIEELVRDMYAFTGTAYKLIITFTPTDGNPVGIKWVSNTDGDYVTETIETEHIRYVNEDEFNYKFYVTGSVDVNIQVRNRLG